MNSKYNQRQGAKKLIKNKNKKETEDEIEITSGNS